MKRMLIALTAAALLALNAHAGRSCEAKAPETLNVQRSLDLAARTMRELDGSGAQVVLLARAGQDLSRYRLRWSHIGWAYKSAPGPAQPAVPRGDPSSPAKPDLLGSGSVWRVVHKLNQCGSATADLYRQGLAEFFLDDPFDYRAAYAVLSAEAQRALLPLLQDNARAATLHNPAYNMVAYPWSQSYQQSNQWAIETLAMALEPGAGSRERAQAWLQFKGYQPTTLQLSAFTRLGARMTAANVAFDDHPNEKRFSDRIETVTADSVFAWLPRAGLAQPPRELR